MLHEFRCEKCGTLLVKEDIEIGEIEIKCYRCNFMNYFNHQSEVISKLFDSIFSAEI